MKKYDIIESSERLEPVSFESIEPHRKQLRIYYNEYECSEPIFIPIFVTNAIQAGIITTESEYYETLEKILDAMDLVDQEERDEERELLISYSFHL